MGHTISNSGIKIDRNKTKAIIDMKAPKNVKELKSFLGMVNYTSKFLPNISKHTQFMRELEKKNVRWHWEKHHQNEFDKVKRMVCSAPILAYFNIKDEITV